VPKDKEKNMIFDFMDLDESEREQLLDDDHDWEEHWVGMPEFVQEDNPPYKKIFMNFRNEEDYKAFAKLIGQNLTEKTKSIWYPKLNADDNMLKRWIEECPED
jgi:hypothetical protein